MKCRKSQFQCAKKMLKYPEDPELTAGVDKNRLRIGPSPIIASPWDLCWSLNAMCSHAVNVALTLGHIGTRQFGSLTQNITNNDDRVGYTRGEAPAIRTFCPRVMQTSGGCR